MIKPVLCVSKTGVRNQQQQHTYERKRGQKEVFKVLLEKELELQATISIKV